MAAMLKSDDGEGKDVEMKEEATSHSSPSESVDSSPKSKGAEGGAAYKEQSTKASSTLNGFLGDPKVSTYG